MVTDRQSAIVSRSLFVALCISIDLRPKWDSDAKQAFEHCHLLFFAERIRVRLCVCEFALGRTCVAVVFIV